MEIVRFEDVRVAAGEPRFHGTDLRVAAQPRALRRSHSRDISAQWLRAFGIAVFTNPVETVPDPS